MRRLPRPLVKCRSWLLCWFSCVLTFLLAAGRLAENTVRLDQVSFRIGVCLTAVSTIASRQSCNTSAFFDKTSMASAQFCLLCTRDLPSIPVAIDAFRPCCWRGIHSLRLRDGAATVPHEKTAVCTGSWRRHTQGVALWRALLGVLPVLLAQRLLQHRLFFDVSGEKHQRAWT